jgi:lipoyl(octanoyl) transferase
MTILQPGRISFEAALALQERFAGRLIEGCGDEVLLLLEHEPVYTIGRTRDRSSLGHTLPHPVFETNRGGQATYHGPGQLVGYPILDLNRRGRDLHRYLRFLENFLIQFAAEFGVVAQSLDGRTGVWVGDRKLASLGVGVKKWVTMHGFAINILRESTMPFSSITPCGLSGVEMTSLEREAGVEISFKEALQMASSTFTSSVEALNTAG